MAEQSSQAEKRPKGLVVRAADGALYKIPNEKLSDFRLSDEAATDLKAKLTWKTEVVQEDPFLFEPVRIERGQEGVQMMRPGTGWCACAGKCNCFCGYCSCA
jgi:hypothetical protein